MPLNDVTLLVTAGGRPGCLKETLEGIWQYLPECRVVVVNDDDIVVDFSSEYHNEVMRNVIWHEVPFDTFLTRKRNEGVKLIDTEYTLLLADDFKIDVSTRAVVIRMLHTLNNYYGDLVGGTVNNRLYEGKLEVKPGEYIKETRIDYERDFYRQGFVYVPTVFQPDLVANFFLARTKLLRDIPWDETIGPIGGEHADWFLDLKEKGKIVLWQKGLDIQEQERDPSKELSSYRARRQRAMLGHELFLKKRGVKCYYSFDEEVR